MSNEVLFLAAGASAEAGVPTAIPMTAEMLKMFRTADNMHVITTQLYYAFERVEKMLKDAGNITAKVNVEQLFNSVKVLDDYKSSELYPFVSRLDTNVKRLDMNFGFGNHTPDDALTHYQAVMQRDWKNANTYKKMISVLESAGQYAERLPGDWEQVLIFMKRALKELVWISSENKVTYLSPILRRWRKLSGMGALFTVVTVNYDNAVELVSSSERVDWEDGILEWNKTGLVPEPSVKKLSLRKIHGSIDWVTEEPKVASAFGKLGNMPIRRLTHNEMDALPIFPRNYGSNAYSPELIFGGRNKLTIKGPFLALINSFVRTISSASVLTVVGYGWGDEHVNGIIAKWLTTTDGVLQIISPGIDETLNPDNYAETINGIKFTHDGSFLSSLSNFAAANPGRVVTIPLKASEGLASLYK